MTGETDLQTLIRNLKPERNPGEYVFCALGPGPKPTDLGIVGWFREHEGVTESALTTEISYDIHDGGRHII